VFGGNVRISSVAVSHGNITISVKNTTAVSQPNEFSQGGNTETVTNQETSVQEDLSRVQLMPNVTTVDQLVSSLNSLGASPRDIMIIMHALRDAGALHAKLEAM
jgi:flagellar P-ring protein precursor FlgI